jgi:preprotein translocase subunit SecD
MKISLRLWILFIALAISILAISPGFESGLLVSTINTESAAYERGLQQGETIIEINSQQIKSLEDYSQVLSQLPATEEDKRIDIKTKNNEYILFTNQSLEEQFTLAKKPRTNIQTGLDLRGGSRALVQPVDPITDSQLQDLVEVSRSRFNIYGISDVNIQGVTDLDGNKFMLIEVAGATPDDLEQLVSQQGKFEAKIANQTVFEGGEKDISDVCRNDATCATITNCQPIQDSSYSCNFQFSIFLKESAAQKHADITAGLSLDETGRYLNESLFLYIDDKEVDALRISSGLKGQVTTEISIQGSGSGATQNDAIKNTRANMNQLQTILLTGSLPYKLEIVKLDTISPSLGSDFIRSIFLAVIGAILVVSLIVFFRYRKFKTSLALLFTAFSDLVIILGVASLIKWNLDLPSIAGILATIGTGVDQQIVIIDEAEREKHSSIKERIKRASFIILSSYLTLVAALLPLYWAGAGLFKGFALTTIIGVTAAILITRPAFADIIKRIEG